MSKYVLKLYYWMVRNKIKMSVAIDFRRINNNNTKYLTKQHWLFDTCVSISQQLLFRIVMKMLSQGHKIVKHNKKCDIKVTIVLQKKIHSFEDRLKMRQIWVERAKCASLVGGGKIPHNCSSEVTISVFIKNLNQGKLFKPSLGHGGYFSWKLFRDHSYIT